jgi:hypothetical protein
MMMKLSRIHLFCPVLYLLGGCAGVKSGEPVGGTGAGAGGNGAAGGGGAGGRRVGPNDNDVTPQTPDAGNCGIVKVMPERLLPDVLIVMDRSISMNEPVMPVGDVTGILNCLLIGPCPSKWVDMTGALNRSVAASQTAINWGLKFFPNDGACSVNEGVAVPIAPNNAGAVNAAIMGTQTGGLTPTAAALASAGRYLMTLSSANPRFVVLATDGQPNCSSAGGTDDAAAIAAVSDLAAAGVPVFVIGIATQGTEGDTTLSSMAVAGGRPRMATPAYYPAATSVDLTAALSAISTQVVSCTFSIPPPPDPTNIAVDADGVRVPRNATDGWDYGANMTSIVLNGSWCAGLQNGSIKTVEAKFACAGIIIP